MAIDLGIHGNLATEWDPFINKLIHGGIRLIDKDDSLFWRWDTSNGKVSVCKDYETITSYLPLLEPKWWFIVLWHWRIPTKLKVFCWLILQNKFLIGDNLIKIGYNGPFVCIHCHVIDELGNH